MEDKDKFIKHINDNYDILKRKFTKACRDLQLELDDDVFQDTILKCYESIQKKKRLNDNSPYGIESYFFQALKQNIKRSKQYAYVQKKDANITSDNVHLLYEEWSNANKTSAKEKLASDLYKDFAVLYILKMVELNFDEECFYLFRLKYLMPEMTYKRLAEKTKIKKVREKVCQVKQWIRENITKQQIKSEFYDIYGSLLEF